MKLLPEYHGLISRSYKRVMPYFMMRFGLLLIMLMSSSFLHSQTDTTEADNSIEIITAVERMPEFIGGNEALMKYVNTNALYTKQAIKDSIEGTVFVSFWIETDGTVSNPKILRGLSPDLDSVCLNLVKNMPNWIPATQRGKSISVLFNFPIKFNMDGRTTLKEPIPSLYWKKRGKRKFEKICKEIYKKSQDECDCWYKFIIWNYNSFQLEMIDLKEMFEKQKCDNK